MRTISIALVDDHNLVREGFKTLLFDIDKVKVVYDTSSGKEFLKQLNTGKNIPDIVLLDLKMPEISGFDVAKYLRKNFPDVKIITLSVFNDEATIVKLLSMGVASCLSKCIEKEELELCIKQVFKKGKYFTEEMTTAIANSLTRKRKRKKLVDEFSLSQLELNVVELVLKEKTNSEIADEICRSKNSVEAIKRRIFEKTGTKSSVGIAKFALCKLGYREDF